MSTVLFLLFVILALAGIALQVRSHGEMRRFAIGSALVVCALPVFALAWVAR